MLIRPERESEFGQIYNLVKTAFATAPVKDGNEQEFVNTLRNSDRYIPELALVVEQDGQLIGHMMLTKLLIQGESQSFESLLLAPIAIVLEHRNKKIGAMLIEESFKRAQAMGYTSVFVVGDPKYYHRFGFRSAIEFGIDNVEAIEHQYVMAHALSPNGLEGKAGKVKLIP